ncbi:MAG: hypothetical protein U9Q30_02940, partial [Campylobacterota bacterium]|nr:hypothetical protein [Campylobacterota bacterium]
NKNIEKNSNVSKSTIKRYRNQRKLENKIKSMAFQEYIKMLGGESVKANEPTPNNEIFTMVKLINFTLKEFEFEYKRTGKKFSFYLKDNDSLVFYEMMEDVELMVA